MRVYLAVALLMLAFVAYTEAQDAETIEEKFSNFGKQMAEVSKNVAEKAKTAFQELHNSEFATESRTWVQKQIENIKAQFNQ
ncbi:apolipoprotein C-I [Cyclopterus lumpus]|uniref:Apolipoprotein C-I n=1 Tax=Cyclopterus lumpus TaxID=8103 RepID=A0A8C2X220_CYCLU|nr:apolipoprotein C-I [Cyclopterus lumpus]